MYLGNMLVLRWAGAFVLAAGIWSAQAARADSIPEEYKETIDQTFPLRPGGAFSLRNTNGSLELTTWEREEVRIVAEKRMRLDSGAVSWLWRVLGLRSEKIETAEDAEKLFEQLVVEFSGDETRREVITRYPESTSGVNFSVSYTVTAPKSVNVTVDTTNGSIRVSDVDGNADLQSTSGSIKVFGVTGQIVAQSTNGRVSIEEASGGVTARTTNGSVEVRMADGVTELQPMQLRSVNGSVELYLPEGRAFDLEARTTNGSVSCVYPLTRTDEQSRKRLSGAVGEGGPLIELRTTNGSARIRN